MKKEEKLTCYHCGLEMHPSEAIWHDGKPFCCNGCKTVYEILNRHDLSQYYTIVEQPGTKAENIEAGDEKFAYLDNPEIAEKLLEFNDGNTHVVSFYIPNIHCASCIWVLEHLEKLNPGIKHSEVNFPAKTVRITYSAAETSLRKVVETLHSIAYTPHISLEDLDKKKPGGSNDLLTKLAVAGFAFGNIMLMAIPEYVQSEGYWIERFAPLFRWISFFLSLPVVLYSARDYYVSAYKGLKNKIISADILLALGIAILFLWSTYEIVSDQGQGYFDSLAGLVFFLLVGKYFQQITYKHLSFERDYKSYFPIAVTKLNGEKEEIIEIKDIRPGDRLLIRNNEIIPVDGIILKNKALVDYSFVTGESLPVEKNPGEKVLAGGKQIGNFIELKAESRVDNSYLTKLWSRETFSKDKKRLKNITDNVSKYFTVAVISLAIAAGVYWYLKGGLAIAIWIMTAVLIVACPCALSLAAPFAFGNILRKFGQVGFYLKNESVLEDLTEIDTIIFDKTGTLTIQEKYDLTWEGEPLSETDKMVLKSMVKTSNHPFSKLIYKYLKDVGVVELEYVEEIAGKGIIAFYKNKTYKLGSASYTGAPAGNVDSETWFHDGEKLRGKFIFKAQYREGLDQLFEKLKKRYEIYILSGDNPGEKEQLKQILPAGIPMFFNQSVHDKTNFIKDLQSKGKKVMMLGDGLNDAGALKQSEVGVAIAESSNVFTPASDAILHAENLIQLNRFLKIAIRTKHIIYAAYFFALIYNIIGFYFALTNRLTPLVAAILMPLSSISIVIFVTFLTKMLFQIEVDFLSNNDK